MDMAEAESTTPTVCSMDRKSGSIESKLIAASRPSEALGGGCTVGPGMEDSLIWETPEGVGWVCGRSFGVVG